MIIDFVLTGVARSGTTLLSKLLSLHSNIFCGGERYSSNINFSKHSESDYINKNIPGNHKVIDQYLKIRDRKGLLLGEKSTEIFYSYSLVDFKKRIYTFRRFSEVVRSWNERANNPNDLWDSRKFGFFSIYDLFSFLFNAPSSNSVIVSYESLYDRKKYSDEFYNCLRYLNCNSIDIDQSAVDNLMSSKQIYQTFNYECDYLYDFLNKCGYHKFENELLHADIDSRNFILNDFQSKLNSHKSDLLKSLYDLGAGDPSVLKYRDFYFKHVFSNCNHCPTDFKEKLIG